MELEMDQDQYFDTSGIIGVSIILNKIIIFQ